MGIADIFKAGENQTLKQRVSELESLLTPEMRDLDWIKSSILQEQEVLEKKRAELAALEQEIVNTNKELKHQHARLIESNEQILLQEFGLYSPKFDFANSEQYKDRLEAIRADQKRMLKNGTASTGFTNWSVNNSAAQGKKMVGDMQKLLLRAFNSECDELVEKVKFNNIDASVKRIGASRDAISKLGSIMGVSIADAYYKLKLNELYLSHEYRVKKQEEKEAEKKAREELREQAKLQKELEEARREIEKEQKHYTNALKKLEAQIAAAPADQQDILLERKRELESQLSELDKSMRDVDYRAANQKAGYVYIISNVGAFGSNVFKIGMTRRLDPMDRVDELGDASVPFNFDVHAMIFTEDAPKLEHALHKAFDTQKLNMVNTRREFFSVSLEEIEAVVRANYDKTVEFVRLAPAEQYRQSIKMRETGTATPTLPTRTQCDSEEIHAAQKLQPNLSDLERRGFEKFCSLFTGYVASGEFSAKKDAGYVSFLYQNNSHQWMARLMIEQGIITLILPDANKDEMRFRIANLCEMGNYKPYILSILARYTDISLPFDPDHVKVYTLDLKRRCPKRKAKMLQPSH